MHVHLAPVGADLVGAGGGHGRRNHDAAQLRGALGPGPDAGSRSTAASVLLGIRPAVARRPPRGHRPWPPCSDHAAALGSVCTGVAGRRSPRSRRARAVSRSPGGLRHAPAARGGLRRGSSAPRASSRWSASRPSLRRGLLGRLLSRWLGAAVLRRRPCRVALLLADDVDRARPGGSCRARRSALGARRRPWRTPQPCDGSCRSGAWRRSPPWSTAGPARAFRPCPTACPERLSVSVSTSVRVRVHCVPASTMTNTQQRPRRGVDSGDSSS